MTTAKTTTTATPCGFPLPLSNLSLWQRTVQDHPLLNVRADGPLPPSADIVIVGGGLCGAVVAHALLYPEEHPFEACNEEGEVGEREAVGSIVMLEARSLASGASGRNAGHCRPDAGRGFPMFAALHGEEGARRILESEAVVLDRYVASPCPSFSTHSLECGERYLAQYGKADASTSSFIARHGIQCEWTPRQTYDVHLTPSFAAHSAESLSAYAASGGTALATPLSAKEGSYETRVTCAGATRWPAATVNPAQLTLGVLSLCEADKRFQAFTSAPVLTCEGEAGSWVVSTPRGLVRARKVVWATNAYTGASGLEGIIVPQAAQAHKLARAPAGPDVFPHLQGSYSMRKSTEVFYSVAPRPDGSVVLGASRGSWPADVKAANIGSVDDRSWHPIVAYEALKGWRELYPSGGWAVSTTTSKSSEEVLARLEKAAAVPGTKDVPDDNGTAGMEYAWSGVIGFTADMVPLVGDVPGRAGQYVAAGYCGHGMARIFLTAPTLAHYIRTGRWDPAMPPSFRTSKARLERLRAASDVAV